MSVVEVGSGRSLPDLAGAVRVEHSQVLSALNRGLTHAVRAGDLLLEARQRVAMGNWAQWLHDETGLSAWQAKTYMRLAFYKDQLPASDTVSITEASRVYLKGLPAIADPNEHRGTSDEISAEVRRCHNDGASVADIANDFGISEDTVRKIVDPAFRQRKIEGKRRSRRNRWQRQRQPVVEEDFGDTDALTGAMASLVGRLRLCAQQAERVHLELELNRIAEALISIRAALLARRAGEGGS